MNRLVLVVLLFAALQVYASPVSKRSWDLAEPLKEDDKDITEETTQATDLELALEKEDDKDEDDKDDDKTKIADKDEVADLAGEVDQQSEEKESPEYGHGPDIVEGDIKLSPEQAALFKTGGWDALAGLEAWHPSHGRWSRTIPYVIDSGIHSTVRSAITFSIGLFHSQTCLRFVPREDYNRNYIRFVDRGGCWSYIGRTGGEQLVSLSRGCTSAVPAHELLHALGRWHEQSRPDRNDYVRIETANIISGQEHNFDRQINSDVQSVPYDYGSVMHYGATAFSRNGQPTIVPLRSGVTIGQRSRLSANDILHTNIRYCPDRAVRLVGNSRGTYEGRVEVFWNGQWGTVCDDSFDISDARTICRYLGFPNAEAFYHRAHFGQGSGPIWFDDMQCTGSEYSPFSCTKNAIGSHNCRHHEDAGVRCQKNVRLVGGTNRCNGRVEVYLNGGWGTVCDDSFGIEEARVICRQLGYRARAAYSRAHYGQGTLPILLDDLECTGNEAQIGFCRSTPVGEHNCGHHEDASVVCY